MVPVPDKDGEVPRLSVAEAGLEFILNVEVFRLFELAVVKAPVMFKIPLRRFTVALLLLVFLVELRVKAPEQVKLASDNVIAVELVVPGERVDNPTLTSAQLKVPVPDIVHVVAVPSILFKVTAPDTVNAYGLLITRALFEPDPINLIDATVVETSRVIVCPAAIVTSSPAPGTPDGDHVPAVFQFPVPVEVLVPASTPDICNTIINSINGNTLMNFESL